MAYEIDSEWRLEHLTDVCKRFKPESEYLSIPSSYEFKYLVKNPATFMNQDRKIYILNVTMESSIRRNLFFISPLGKHTVILSYTPATP